MLAEAAGPERWVGTIKTKGAVRQLVTSYRIRR